MVVERLRLFNFRCYEQVEIEADPSFNVIVGLNGQGKTSLLESLGLLAFFKSFRQAKNEELLRFETTEGLIQGKIKNQGLSFDLDVKLWPNRKQATFNKKPCRYLSEYVGKLSAVSFSPADLEIVRGEPENRRQWMDRLAQIYFATHIDAVTSYKRVLEHRNRQLKLVSEGKRLKLPGDFEVWNQEFVNLGAKVIHNRIHSVDKSVDKISYYYQKIARECPQIRLNYVSKVCLKALDRELDSPLDAIRCGQESQISIELIKQSLLEFSEKMLSKELVLGTTLVGPHRDDLGIFFGEKPVKAFGSQGEIRSLVLAMRLAETEAHKNQTGLSPVLLIDDFSSELDSNRRKFLLDYLSQTESQVFLTTTENIELGKVFVVKEGKVFSNGYGNIPPAEQRESDEQQQQL